MCLVWLAFAQQVHFDYDRSANFSAYKTYQWVDYQPVAAGDQLWIRTSSALSTSNSPARVCGGSRVVAICRSVTRRDLRGEAV